MYKNRFGVNNLQCLICHKTKPNQIFLSKSNNPATGPDEIHYTLLKELLTISLKYLLNIYIQYLDLWKHSYLMKASNNYPYPHKAKKKSHKPHQFYMALNNFSGKTLEKMINLRLTWFLESNNLLSNQQTGFRVKRSTMNQIICIETLIWEAFIKKEHLVAVIFTLKKPRIWHGRMAYSKISKILAYKADSLFLCSLCFSCQNTF